MNAPTHKPTTSRAERLARYRRPLAPDSPVPDIAKQLKALEDAIPLACLEWDYQVDCERMAPAVAQALKHRARHALRTFARTFGNAPQNTPESDPPAP